jgi:hypothetical protein
MIRHRLSEIHNSGQVTSTRKGLSLFRGECPPTGGQSRANGIEQIHNVAVGFGKQIQRRSSARTAY